MICPNCYGKGVVGKVEYTDSYSRDVYHIPCAYCEGQGYLHCCEGMEEQPESSRCFALNLPLMQLGKEVHPSPINFGPHYHGSKL